jgi:hypothetical protein
LPSRFADARQPLEPLLDYGVWLKTACVVAFAGGALGLIHLRSGRRTAAILSVSLTALVARDAGADGARHAGRGAVDRPDRLPHRRCQRAAARRRPFYTIRMYDQTLPYYIGRTVTQVEHYDELAMGIASEPDKAIATEAEWRRRWKPPSRRTRSCSRMNTSGFTTKASPCESSDGSASRHRQPSLRPHHP